MPKTSKISNKEIHPPSWIKHRDKATWVAVEEATLIVTLLLQKAAGNSLQSMFKPAVWPLVVNAVGEAMSEGVRKSAPLQVWDAYLQVMFAPNVLMCFIPAKHIIYTDS